MAELDQDNLRLTDFMDLPTLQEIQDSFAAVAGVSARITDANGNLLTQPAPTREFLRRQRAIAEAEAAAGGGRGAGPAREGAEYVAPIIVNNQRVATIRMSGTPGLGVDEAKLAALAERCGIDLRQLKSLSTQLARARNTRPAAIQFLFLLANAIARLCYQEFQLRQRVDELTAVYNVTTLLSDARDLGTVLNRTVELIAQLMKVRSSSIRLIDQEKDELTIKAVYNLSPEYLAKGAIKLSSAHIDQVALSEQGYEYVADMARDPRVLYPQESIKEGIVSMLSVGMRYKGRAIGVVRVYSHEQVRFSPNAINLLKAVAAQVAAAIENARLLEESLAAEALEKQVQMAAQVQQRMVPRWPPTLASAEVSAIYVPCFELGGDFYDFIPLPDDNVGLVIADVSGKGVPASLIMASVRAFLRAEVDLVYYLYEIVRRINLMLCRDTQPGEFVTLFYGVLDQRNRRMTYCSAGHPPALLLREGKISDLSSDNMVLGVDPQEQYRQSVVELKSDDLLLLYTDGLTDAMNFQQQTYGRHRLVEAFARGGATAEIVAQNILWDMRRFVGLTHRTDDVTMVVARMR